MVQNQYFLLPVPQQPGFGGQGQHNRPQGGYVVGPQNNGLAQPVRILGVATPIFDQPAFGVPFGLRPDGGASVGGAPFPGGGFPIQQNPMNQALDQIFAMIDRLILAALALLNSLYGTPNGQQPGQFGQQPDTLGDMGEQGDLGWNNGQPGLLSGRPDGGATVGPRFGNGGGGQPVAANQKARAFGDPHIEGADGEKFDFDDHGVYSLLQDQGLGINAEMGPAAGEKSVITNVGMNIGGAQVQLLPSGSVIVNGRPVQLESGQTLQLPDGSRITKQGNDIKLQSREYDVTFSSRAKGQYFDVAVQSKNQGVMQDGVAPSGILGETFDEDNVAGGGTKHPHDFYRRRGILAF